MIRFSNELVDKILNYKTILTRDKIDRLLELDANQYCNIGIDTPITKKFEVKKNSRYIYRAIQKLDYDMGSNFLQAQDK